VERADHLAGDVDVVGQERAARQVERHLDQRLVERQKVGGEAADAGLVAQRLGEGRPEGDAGVLDGVVGVDLEVAPGGQLEVETAVAADLLQHVVEERDAGRHLGHAGAVEVDPHRDLGLLGGALLLGHSRAHAERTSFRAARKASFSSGRPIVTRRQLSRRGQRAKLRTSTPAASSPSHVAWPSAVRNRMKLAPDGKASTPSRASRAAATRSRSVTMEWTRAPIWSVKRTATVPAAWVGTDRW